MKFIKTRGLFLALVLCASAQASQIQMQASGGVLRSMIESYPERERRPLLDYLDRAHVLADTAVKDLAEGGNEGIVAQALDNPTNIAAVLEAIRGMYGSVTSYEYRNQAIELPGNSTDMRDLNKVIAATFYAVRTTKKPEEGLYLTIRTQLGATGEQSVVAFQFLEYIGDVPPWVKKSR